MSCRSLIALWLCLFAVVGRSGTARERTADDERSLDALVAACRNGDAGAIAQTFRQGQDFQDKLYLNDRSRLDRWLGPWDRDRAMFLLEVADTATRVAPRFTSVIAAVGRDYAQARRWTAPAEPDDGFVRLYHRTALALVVPATDPRAIEAYLNDLDRGSRGRAEDADARFVLVRGVAKERECHYSRPSRDQAGRQIDDLGQAAGVTVDHDLDGPRRGVRDARVTGHEACLGEALARFETASRLDEIRAEALVRGGWILWQLNRPAEAIERLDAARPGDDRVLGYWRGVVRGRVLEGLGRDADAEAAYRGALDSFPRARTAGLGVALTLMRLFRAPEADAIARQLRAPGVEAPDPWNAYLDADGRFVDEWMGRLRELSR